MNERNDMETDETDRDLLDELKRSQRGSSRAHDDAVLATAKATAEDIAGRDDSRSQTTTARRHTWLMPAAAALAAVMLVPMLIDNNDDTLRNPVATVAPAQSATLAGAPARFRWPAVPGADRYIVILRDAGASEVWRSATVLTPELSPDSSAMNMLAAGGTFIWTVEAQTPGATTELGPFQFTVAE